MPRINTTFKQTTYEQIVKNAQIKGIPLSQYVQALAEIGLRVEEAAKHQSSNQTSEIASLGELKNLWRTGLARSLEACFLIRYLVVHALEDEQGEHRKALTSAKEKSEAFVAALLQEAP